MSETCIFLKEKRSLSKKVYVDDQDMEDLKFFGIERNQCIHSGCAWRSENKN